MFWIEKYRPRRFGEIIGQDQVARHLASFAEQRNVPHLLITGPHGTGKSSAVECLARGLYGETWEENTTFIPAGDLLASGRGAMEKDERFAHLYQKDLSLLANFKYIVRWYASMKPLDAEFKLMVFEGAEGLTHDAQAALRRIMEQYSSTCRFIYVTTRPSAIIPAIASRCLILFFAPIPQALIAERLRSILACEGIDRPVPEEELELVVQMARGDLRMAIMLLQELAVSGQRLDPAAITVSETDAVAASAFSSLRKGDLAAAIRMIESLFIEYGMTGPEVVASLRRVVRQEYNHPMLVLRLAETDYLLRRGHNEFVQVNALLSGLLDGVPGI